MTCGWVRWALAGLIATALGIVWHVPALAAAPPPPVSAETSQSIRIALMLTLLAVLPGLVICMTSFVRVVIVLSMIRHAFGMPETPPNAVLVSLALFLTALTMGPAISQIDQTALRPFMAGQISLERALEQGSGPLKAFMLRQVHDQDLRTIYAIAKQPLPTRPEEVGLMQLAPAFMLNELRTAFTIGFLILLPFLLIDLVVSSVLLSLGMIMVPPATLSLPIKLLMFVLIDGWSLILEGVIGGFR
jgi:flagellar biosynthesis protein FliP